MSDSQEVTNLLPLKPLNTEERWQVTIYHEGHAHYVHRSPSSTLMGSVGEALHAFSMDRNVNLNEISKLEVWPVRREPEVEGVPV